MHVAIPMAIGAALGGGVGGAAGGKKGMLKGALMGALGGAGGGAMGLFGAGAAGGGAGAAPAVAGSGVGTSAPILGQMSPAVAQGTGTSGMGAMGNSLAIDYASPAAQSRMLALQNLQQAGGATSGIGQKLDVANKAVSLARGGGGKQTEAAAPVAIDRQIGVTPQQMQAGGMSQQDALAQLIMSMLYGSTGGEPR